MAKERDVVAPLHLEGEQLAHHPADGEAHAVLDAALVGHVPRLELAHHLREHLDRRAARHNLL